jgi:hypothetical protein
MIGALKVAPLRTQKRSSAEKGKDKLRAETTRRDELWLFENSDAAAAGTR